MTANHTLIALNGVLPDVDADVDPVRLLAWGTNNSGQLGNADTADIPTPSVMPCLRGHGVRRVLGIGCGVDHTLVLCECAPGPDASHDDPSPRTMVLGWGSNEYGQIHGLGTGRQGQPRRPVPPAPVAMLAGLRVLGVACGFYHSVAVVEEGPAETGQAAQTAARSLLLWGMNSNGELGGNPVPGGPGYLRLDLPGTGGDSGTAIRAVAVGAHHTLALTEAADGTTRVYAWGIAARDPSDGARSPSPTEVGGDQAGRLLFGGRRVLAIACGAYHSVAVCDETAPHEEPRQRTVFAWARLGQSKQVTPFALGGLPRDQQVVAVACGTDFTVVVTVPLAHAPAAWPADLAVLPAECGPTAVYRWTKTAEGAKLVPLSSPRAVGLWCGRRHAVVALAETGARATKLVVCKTQTAAKDPASSYTCIALPADAAQPPLLPAGSVTLHPPSVWAVQLLRASGELDTAAAECKPLTADVSTAAAEATDVAAAALSTSRTPPSEIFAQLIAHAGRLHTLRAKLKAWEREAVPRAKRAVQATASTGTTVEQARTALEGCRPRKELLQQQLAAARETRAELERRLAENGRQLATLNRAAAALAVEEDGLAERHRAARADHARASRLEQRLQAEVASPQDTALELLGQAERQVEAALVRSFDAWRKIARDDEELTQAVDRLRRLGIAVRHHLDRSGLRSPWTRTAGAEYCSQFRQRHHWSLAEALKSVAALAELSKVAYEGAGAADAVASLVQTPSAPAAEGRALLWLLTREQWLLDEANRALIEDRTPLFSLAAFLHVAQRAGVCSPAATAPGAVYCRATLTDEELKGYEDLARAGSAAKERDADVVVWRGFTPATRNLRGCPLSADVAPAADGSDGPPPAAGPPRRRTAAERFGPVLFKIELPRPTAADGSRFVDLSGDAEAGGAAGPRSAAPAEVDGFLLPNTRLRCRGVRRNIAGGAAGVAAAPVGAAAKELLDLARLVPDSSHVVLLEAEAAPDEGPSDLPAKRQRRESGILGLLPWPKANARPA